LPSETEGYERALALNPRHALAHRNRSLGLLALGDYENGWEEYEWRLRCRDVQGKSRIILDPPVWNGEDVRGKRVFVYCEQGLGDALHFGRYLGLLAERGARVIAEAREPVLSLLAQSFPGVEFIPSSHRCLAPEFDYQCPLLSLPRGFRTTVASIPAEIPYLRAPVSKIARWAERLADRERKFRVGLAWAGNPSFRDDAKRSCPLAEFASLLSLDEIDWFSLQVGQGSAQIENLPRDLRSRLVDWTEEFADFSDTAALVSQLDLVICVDTSIAHLSGGLGIPTFLLLAHRAEWRWFCDRNDSPWYPQTRLFRQPTPGDWSSAIREVKTAVEARLRSGA
jgi:hypothetical protein